MPSVAPALRTSEQVRSEIEQTFGFFPPFYEPALASPQVLENLWQQTLSAYIENPLSALFKEKLNALLSRFCAAPYCIIVHSAALRPLGMTAQQVLALLDAPPSDPTTELPLGGLPVPTSEEATAPTPDSLLEKTLLYCATPVFLERADAPACQAELRRLLGPRLYSHLVAYLAYIKTCHTWIEAHPEVSHEADRRVQDNLGPLLAEEPALGDFFRHYQERVRAQGLGKERRRAADDTLRTEQARTARILESITDAFFALDHEWRFTFLNAQAERLLLRPRAELLGRNVWAEFPATVGTDFDRHYHHAVNAQTSVTFEAYYPPPLDTWFEVRAFPSPEGLSVFFHDITERVGRRQRERFLAELAERARRLTDPDEVIADAVRSARSLGSPAACSPTSTLRPIPVRFPHTTAPTSRWRASRASSPSRRSARSSSPSTRRGAQPWWTTCAPTGSRPPLKASPRMRPSASAPTLPRPFCTRPASFPPSQSTAPCPGTGKRRKWSCSRPWWSGRG